MSAAALGALPCAMKLARLGGVDLEYAVEGVGEPVVLVHAGAVADFFAPLVGPLARSGRFRVVHYHRVGYGGSSVPAAATPAWPNRQGSVRPCYSSWASTGRT